MDWKKIDLFPKGPAGVEARWRERDGIVYCYIQGSDHWIDWFHHFLPFAKAREIGAGKIIANQLRKHGTRFVIGGHSLGGAIAVVVGYLLRSSNIEVSVFAYGGKRAPCSTSWLDVAVVKSGDIVPCLPPWRPKYKNIFYIPGWVPFWKAHAPKMYYDIQRSHGLRD